MQYDCGQELLHLHYDLLDQCFAGYREYLQLTAWVEPDAL